ncbi:MAG: LamG domain-containing protein [Planctomycetia bacterium]|nr:LamG domain-containing protein [Planctomycetia bacterium]
MLFLMLGTNISRADDVDKWTTELSATVTLLEAAKQFSFFGSSWSAWPSAEFADQGYEAAVLIRAAEQSGYRVQLSHKYQDVALVKYPEGGYVQVAPCAIELKKPYVIVVSARGSEIVVSVDGQEKIRYRDTFLPLTTGRVGIGVSSGARVAFEKVELKTAPPESTTVAMKPAPRKFALRTWLGGRPWVFDGNEPILQLHNVKDPSCFAKLKPGYKPQLTFDSHWGIENQGAFPEGKQKWTDPVVSGGGESLQATWSALSLNSRFTTKSKLTVGFDADRGMYTYDIESELEVLPGEPFHFRYGFDFEHHTPLDPFRWQYLIAKRKGGELYHRPLYPVDPGPQYDLETYYGLRVWYGRHVDRQQVAPTIEYDISPEWNRDPKDPAKPMHRKLDTAVCAAFYDTAVAFATETSPPGTKVRVKYRYTGYPVEEAKKLFEHSKVYDAPTLDPKHHYIFADEWPKLTFGQFVPMSETWIYGRTPFMTAHNVRPSYELEKNCGAGSGFAMKLGPASFGKANLPLASSATSPLAKGRYVVTALVKSVNAHGEGGRIEVTVSQAKTGKPLSELRHFVGNGSFDWQRQGFVFEVPEEGGSLAVAFGNAGTGAMLVTDVEFRKLGEGEQPANDVAHGPKQVPPAFSAAPAGAIADYRMEEGQGLNVLNYAAGAPVGGSSLGHLDLANVDWVVDAGRPALRFAENTTGRKDYRIDSGLNRFYLSNPSYEGKNTVPAALAGHHGGGAPLKGVTISAWIKPAPAMGISTHPGKGDIVGFGGRRFVLSLQGDKAPYQLASYINVSDAFVSDTKLEADRWYHVAMTAEPSAMQWHVRLFVDGKQAGEGTTKKFSSESPVVPSVVFGTEIFYFHHAYYRGLIGRTLIFDRCLSPSEIAEFAKR